MVKSDLKSGMVIKMRNGVMLLLIEKEAPYSEFQKDLLFLL